MMKSVVGLDMGGTWMKGVAALVKGGRCEPPLRVLRRPNPLHQAHDAEDFAKAVGAFCRELAGDAAPLAVTVATAGEVDAAGKAYRCAGVHLGIMGTSPWIAILEETLGCPVTMVNDAEAFLLGVADRGLAPVDANVGGMVVGTGLGFAMTRQGRWWKPARRLIHLGAVATREGDYNFLGSAVRAAETGVFSGRDEMALERYLEALADVAATAVNLFALDVLVLGGGAVDAAKSADIGLAAALQDRIDGRLLPKMRRPEVIAVEGGNQVILEGALALAAGNVFAEAGRCVPDFGRLLTETNAVGPGIETLSPEEIVARLAREEAEAAGRFCDQVPALVKGAAVLEEALRAGGRIIYLGAGTSGRVGALDAVEIPCTFGLGPDRFVAVIAGGVADAALTIEDQCEEDTSSVADLILLGLQACDVVVGISASGTAYFVRSGLAFARGRGARTLLLHEAEGAGNAADVSIRLESGPEVITGSTRLKAGTATKKALNILSTAAMIALGKVRCGEMIDLHCCNAKLRQRAIRILTRLRGGTEEEAGQLLAENGYQLRRALEA